MIEPGFLRGDVVLCALPGGYGKPRPAVVVQSDLYNETHASIVLCPISSEVTGLTLFRIAISASEASGLKKESEVMVDKITAARRTRIARRIGVLSTSQMNLVDDALRTWLELPLRP
ncbi:MAG: type II toxin-antitoxin system PemK/MazF family toxin [Gammaproteobacteria bacterium]